MANQFTGLQLAFIDAYVGKARFNKTEAARLAGYAGNGNTLAQIGFKLVKNGKIKEEIRARLQAKAMSSDELVMRLGEQGRIDITDYYDTNGKFALDRFKVDGHGHLVKSIKKDKDGNLVIEFIDKLKSQELIARHLGVLVDKSEVTEIDGGSMSDFEEWKEAQSKRESEAMETLGQFDNND